jgi:hypothetical protein
VIDGANSLKQIQAPPTRHLLVQQNDTVRLALKQDEGIVSVGAGLDRESLLFQKQDMRGEAFHLIVHPQNALGTGHTSN